MSELLPTLGKKTATILYPLEKVDVSEGFRSRFGIRDDRCIGCSKCSPVCPADAITMIMEKEKRKIKFANKEITREKYPRVNLLSCIRCGVCEESCLASPKAIYLTTNFGGAALENQILIVPTVLPTVH